MGSGGWKVGGWGVGSANTTVDEALACHHQCGLGSSTGVDATSPWVEFAAGFPLSPRGFSPGSPVFPFPQKTKTNISNSNPMGKVSPVSWWL